MNELIPALRYSPALDAPGYWSRPVCTMRSRCPRRRRVHLRVLLKHWSGAFLPGPWLQHRRAHDVSPGKRIATIGPILFWGAGGPWPWLESYVRAQWASEHSFQLLNALNLSGYWGAGGPWPWLESYVRAQWASEHSFQLLNALNLSGYAATAPAPPSKGRLIRCTVPGSIPNCLAMQTPAASLAASNSGTGPVPVTINSGILASATE